MNAWWTLGDTRRGGRDSEEKDKSSVNTNFFFFFFFSYCAQPKVAMHCSCRAKKYSFDSTIVGYILIFSSAKNNYITI